MEQATALLRVIPLSTEAQAAISTPANDHLRESTGHDASRPALVPLRLGLFDFVGYSRITVGSARDATIVVTSSPAVFDPYHLTIGFDPLAFVITIEDQSTRGTWIIDPVHRSASRMRDKPHALLSRMRIQFGAQNALRFDIVPMFVRDQAKAYEPCRRRQAISLGLPWIDMCFQDRTSETGWTVRTDTSLPVMVEEYFRLFDVGSGSSGQVSKCVNLKTHAVVAIKLFDHNQHAEVFIRPQGAELEARILRNARHPYVTRYVGFHTMLTHSAGYSALVQEFVGNGSLADILNEEVPEDVPLMAPIQQVYHILAQCLDALVYLHHHNIIHHDISICNILIRSWDPFVVCLADFSEAEITIGPFSARRGYTREYGAPEIRHADNHTSLVDVYALGVTALHMLRCCPDIYGDEPDAPTLQPDQKHFVPALVRDLSADCFEVLSGMLTFQPSQRYTARQALCSKFLRDWEMTKESKRVLSNLVQDSIPMQAGPQYTTSRSDSSRAGAPPRHRDQRPPPRTCVIA